MPERLNNSSSLSEEGTAGFPDNFPSYQFKVHPLLLLFSPAEVTHGTSILCFLCTEVSSVKKKKKKAEEV